MLHGDPAYVCMYVCMYVCIYVCIYVSNAIGMQLLQHISCGHDTAFMHYDGVALQIGGSDWEGYMHSDPEEW